MKLEHERGIVPALDMSRLSDAKEFIIDVDDAGKLTAYKVGSTLASDKGHHTTALQLKRVTSKPLIYDHQKFGSDTPNTVRNQLETFKEYDAVIAFPFGGSETRQAISDYARDLDIDILWGGVMTQPGFHSKEGGYVHYTAIGNVYRECADEGWNMYVLPATRPNVSRAIRKAVESRVDPDKVMHFAPGWVTQGGDMSEADEIVGPRAQLIKGRSLIGAENPAEAVETYSALI